MAWLQKIISIYGYLRPALDVAILAFLLYQAYKLLVKTQAMQLVKGAGLLALVYGVSFLLKLSTLQWILTNLWPGLFITVAIVFFFFFRKILFHLG
jgi:diadenylate cyclase